MNFGADCGLMGLVAERKGGKESSHGYIFQKGQPNTSIERVELESEFAGEQKLHDKIRARLHPAGGGAVLEVTGRVLSMVPCRNHPAGWVTRVAEGMTEWRLDDRVGYGMSEYLDHLHKGE